MLETMLIRTSPHSISVKISEDLVRHDFTIKDGWVEYLVCKSDGEPVAVSLAELADLKESDTGNVRGLVIRTQLYSFEVVQDENYRYHAYRSKRH